MTKEERNKIIIKAIEKRTSELCESKEKAIEYIENLFRLIEEEKG